MLGSIHMGWRHVCFLNWPVDAAVVRPHVPDAMTLDTHDGRAWLSLVPFVNVDVRPAWLPAGTGFRLQELNLRTYVTRGDRPGVYFFSLDAQGLLSVLGARLFHHLPYFYARIDLAVDDGRVRFECRRVHPGAPPNHVRLTYEPTGEVFVPDSGSLAGFLTDRDRYYTLDTGGDVRFADVTHEPWRLSRADVELDRNTSLRANGFEPPEAEPVGYYSPGVDTLASESHQL